MGLSLCCVSESLLYAEALSRLLEAEPWVSSVSSCVGITGLAALPDSDRPDVALVSCAPTQQVEWIRILVRDLRCTVVAVGVTGSAEELVRCAEAGAAGYFFLEQSSAELQDVVSAAVRGEVLCSPAATGVLLRHVSSLARWQSPVARLDRLTAREHEVLSLLSDGRSNKEIARGLAIDLCTAKNHVHNILEKLHVSRRGEAAALIRGEANSVEITGASR